MTAGTHIKDKLKRVKAKDRRDSCKYYCVHSGGCIIHKILTCYKCLDYDVRMDLKIRL